MENQTIIDVLEEAHGMTHDISFNIREGNIDEAQKLLRSQDTLLHDAIHQQCLPSEQEDVFNSIASVIKPH